eukprot:COSAG06_NODE_895_length_11669_cov_5.131384_11_plen_98_part_00
MRVAMTSRRSRTLKAPSPYHRSILGTVSLHHDTVWPWDARRGPRHGRDRRAHWAGSSGRLSAITRRRLPVWSACLPVSVPSAWLRGWLAGWLPLPRC